MRSLSLAARSSATTPADRLVDILHGLGTNIRQISRAARVRFGPSDTRYLIPHNLGAKLRHGTPASLFHLAALSILTGRRFADWAGVFGFELDRIPWLQLVLHSERTIAVALDGVDLNILPRAFALSPRRTGPLVTAPDEHSAEHAAEAASGHRLCVRIGRRDCLPATEAVTGTLLLVDATRTALHAAGTSSPLYLVQHPGGLSCCHIDQLAPSRVVLLSAAATGQMLELQLGRQAIILGTVDAWLRPMAGGVRPRPQALRGAQRQRSVVRLAGDHSHFGRCLRASRQRLGLTLRDVHAVAGRFAAHLGDSRYDIALGSLVRAEREPAAPRHMSTIVALSVAYALALHDVLRASGIETSALGSDSLEPETEGSR